MQILINDSKINYIYHKVPNNVGIVVFIHGWMDSMDDSKLNYQELLKDGFSVLRFDLPGHGKSSYIKEYNLDIYCDYVIKLINALGIKTFSLIGHSMGAIISSSLFKSEKERVKGVFLLDPPLGKYPSFVNVLLPIVKILNILGLLKFFFVVIKKSKVFHNKWSDTFIGINNNRNQDARKVTIDGILAVDVQAIVSGVIDTLSNKMIAQPVKKNDKIVIIYGENDPVIDTARVKELFNEGNKYVISNERHTPNRTNPEWFNKIVLKHLRQNIVK